MHRIRLAHNTGFCSGVKRAVAIAESVLARHNGRVYSLGSIIHNQEVIDRLKSRGLFPVSSLSAVPRNATVILPSHGCPCGVRTQARLKRLKLIDVTCPYVFSVHSICRRLYRNHIKVIIIGDRKHPEVEALIDLAPDACLISSAADIRPHQFDGCKVGIISQTTQSKEDFFAMVGLILRSNPGIAEARIFNTICLDTSRRQEEVKKLAEAVNTLLVVGSRTSANTKRLLHLGRKVNRRTYLVENSSSIPWRTLRGARSIGVISGASAPDWLVRSIVASIRNRR